MNNFLKLILCLGLLFFWGSLNGKVRAADIELGNDATVLTSQFPTLQPVLVSGTSGLRFSTQTASLLHIRVNTSTAFLNSLFLRIYDPSTGIVLSTLGLNSQEISQYNAGANLASTSAVFSFSDFVGTLPEGQNFALAVTARFTCNGTFSDGTGCTGFAGINVSLVPEPATILLLPTGLAAVALRLRKRRWRN